MNFPIKCFAIVSILLLLFTIGCSGDSSKSDFPNTCVEEGFKFENNNLVLNEGSSSKQSLYLFHNISDENFLINHPVTKDPGASAGWGSNLSSGNWSALAIDGAAIKIENFEITCSIIGDGKVDYLDCKNVIKTCRFKEPVFNSENSGSFWVAENKPLSNLLDAIKSRGISW
jgi:hypothetical protein